MFEFRVYGRPAPQGSKKYVGNGRFIEASKYLAPWRKAVANAIFTKLSVDPNFLDFKQVEDPVVVEVVFLLEKPKGIKRLWPSVMPDTDKLQRAIGDALETDTAFLASDSLIVKWVPVKVYAPSPEMTGALINVRLATQEDLDAALNWVADYDERNK